MLLDFLVSGRKPLLNQYWPRNIHLHIDLKPYAQAEPVAPDLLSPQWTLPPQLANSFENILGWR